MDETVKPSPEDAPTLAGNGPAVRTVPTRVEELRAWPNVPGYQIQDEIGKGGMGVVYRAIQLNLNRVVAIKMVRGAGGAAREVLARFLTEAELEARLQHPNFVQVHEVGTHDGCPFFSMEYIEGGNLAARMKADPVGMEQAARWMTTLARAVHHAHQQGIVHRDLKPANVMIAAEGQLKITDFGLAKHLTQDTGLTQSGAVMGTPAYMAPEQAAGHIKDIGPAADIYSLGAILYEMLSGRPPFEGASGHEILSEVLASIPQSPSLLRQGISRDLETISLKCLEKLPARRYATAQELAEDLERFLRGEPVLARRIGRWRRGVMWSRRQPVAAAAVTVVVLMAVFGPIAGMWYWDSYIRLHVAHFSTFTYHLGAPVGIGILSEAQVRHRPYSLRFLSRGGRVQRLEVVDNRGRITSRSSHGTLIGALQGEEGAASEIYEYRYDGNGTVTDEACVDRAGAIRWNFHYDTRENGHYSDKQGYVRGRTGSGAAYVEFKWSKEGYRESTRYCDFSHSSQPDEQGTFGLTLVSDARGLPVKVTYLGLEGRPAACRTGHAVEVYTYDALGNPVEVSYLGVDGKPVPGPAGVYREHKTFDVNGSMTKITYLDADGRPMYNSNGQAGYRMEWVESGDESRMFCLDLAGGPALVLGGYAGMVVTYDGTGNLNRVSFRDLDGKSVVTLLGYATVQKSFDAGGRLTAEEYFDAKGAPTLTTDGFSRKTLRYDDDGRLQEEAYFGTDGKPALCKENHAGKAYVYDSAGHRTEESTFDTHHKPLPVDGFARKTNTHDQRWNLISETFLGVDGNPALHRQGFYRRTRGYDAHGYLSEEAYFDKDGNPTACTGGYARVAYHNDDFGMQLETAYFDRFGHSTYCRQGFAKLKVKYDERGMKVQEEFFGMNGRPCLHSDGYCRAVHAYELFGRETRTAYFGLDGSPASLPAGYARMDYSYNRLGNLVGTACFGVDGKPVLNKQGYAKNVTAFDSVSHVTQIDYFGTDGQPILLPEGYSICKVTCNAQGFRKEEQYLGKDGKTAGLPGGYSRITGLYDNRGLRIESAFRDSTGALVTVPGAGFARGVQVMDARGHIFQLQLFDHRGQRISGAGGFACWQAEYDDRGNRTACTYYGVDGKPLAGRAHEQVTFDDRGYISQSEVFDRAGRAVTGADGHAGFLATYDDHGNLTERTWLAGGKPAAGACRQTFEYNIRGQLMRTAYFDASGARATGPEGYAGLVHVRDPGDVVIDSIYTDDRDARLPVHPLVTTVEAGTLGAQLGLQPGDIILRYDGQPAGSVMAFVHSRKTEPPGGPPRELVVLRQAREVVFRVKHDQMGVVLEDRIGPLAKTGQ